MGQRYILHTKDLARSTVLANLHAFIDRLPATKSWRIEINQHSKTRTTAQNHALFGVAYPVLCEATGYTPDEIHEACCRRFFGTVERDIFGHSVQRPFRTTTCNEQGMRDVMSAKDFAQFYEMAQQIGAEIGVDVPSPTLEELRDDQG